MLRAGGVCILAALAWTPGMERLRAVAGAALCIAGAAVILPAPRTA